MKEIETSYPDIAIFLNSRTQEIRVYNYNNSESKVISAEIEHETNNLITLKLKIKTMSDVQEFVDGLIPLMDDAKAKGEDLSSDFEEYIKEAGTEFQEKSHTYAKDMTQLMNQLTLDVQALYKEVYGEDMPGTTPPEGETEPPIEGTVPPEGTEGVPDQTLPENLPEGGTPPTPEQQQKINKKKAY